MGKLLRALAALVSTMYSLPPVVCQVLLGAVLHTVGHITRDRRLRKYGRNIALSADQHMNVIWLGHADETISSRIGRAALSGKPRLPARVLHPIVDRLALLFNDPNHCIKSAELHFNRKPELWRWHD
jgi:hypothetical protein